jgi:hypothetical protein
MLRGLCTDLKQRPAGTWFWTDAAWPGDDFLPVPTQYGAAQKNPQPSANRPCATSAWEAPNTNQRRYLDDGPDRQFPAVQLRPAPLKLCSSAPAISLDFCVG